MLNNKCEVKRWQICNDKQALLWIVRTCRMFHLRNGNLLCDEIAFSNLKPLFQALGKCCKCKTYMEKLCFIQNETK